MSTPYFSERQLGLRPRVREEIPENVWGGILTIVQRRIADGSFGYAYPEQCPDGRGISGCDKRDFEQGISAYVPELPLPLNQSVLPHVLVILDFIEFCYQIAAVPRFLDYHDYYGHHHLAFALHEGQQQFRSEINRLFERNGIAYELDEQGHIQRIAPLVVREALSQAVFQTGDDTLDRLLEDARAKYLSPNPEVRHEALQELWDAWERLKTLEPAKDKKESITILLDKAADEPNLRATLEAEAKELTRIGNTFSIRHSETTQIAIQRDTQIDYVFHRLFALVQLLLRSR